MEMAKSHELPLTKVKGFLLGMIENHQVQLEAPLMPLAFFRQEPHSSIVFVKMFEHPIRTTSSL